MEVVNKILLLGLNGQVGWELNRSLACLGDLISLDRNSAEFAQISLLRSLILDVKPDIIVNAVAYTAVDKAEQEEELAFEVNAGSLKVIAEAAREMDAWLVHYSTDYVYDGEKAGPYIETDEVNPLSVYGRSKLAGEEEIRKSGCKHLIFRTSWVFSSRRHNFLKTILDLASKRKQLNIVADQFGAPTSAELIADITAKCVQRLSIEKSYTQNSDVSKNLCGTYHLAAKGEVSWFSFAQRIVKRAKEKGASFCLKTDNILPVSTSQYPLAATRPCHSRLSTAKLENVFSINLPYWSDDVDSLIDELVKK